MKFPNYNWNSTVNLISSIQWYCWVSATYPESDILSSQDLKKHDNVVLFLVDALWYKWLEKYGQDSFLYKYLKSSISSAFPSTTSTAITTFSTGLTGSEHAILWWNMYSKELGSTIQILPWKHKILGVNLWDKVQIEHLAPARNFYKESKKDIIIVTNNSLKDSKYNRHYNQNTKVLGYTDLPGCFDQVYNAITLNQKQKYIYTYWGDFDSTSHNYGVDSAELARHFEDIDAQFKKLYERIRGTNTAIIVTADHGQINIPEHKKIAIDKAHPELVDMLALPLAWEPRCQYCFVQSDKISSFREYVENNLSDICMIFSKEEVLERQLFGHGGTPQFFERIGDFVLIPKDDYTIFHYTLWENMDTDVAFHGWLHEWETQVPVVYMVAK